jgi:hypothetical protein
MRTDADAQRPEIDSWRPELVRLTSFVRDELDVLNVPWMDQLFGAGYRRVREERVGPSRTQTIDFGNGFLSLTVLPGIVHWNYSPNDPNSAEVRNLPFPEFARPFLEFAPRWLEICPDVQRLAWGPILRLYETDREASYRRLSSFLNFNLEAETSFDFSYQINRPRNSRVVTGPLLRINRLSRWSAGSSFLVVLHPTMAAPRRINSFCRLELDINTDAENEALLPRESVPALLDELVAMADEILREGDIA